MSLSCLAPQSCPCPACRSLPLLSTRRDVLIDALAGAGAIGLLGACGAPRPAAPPSASPFASSVAPTSPPITSPNPASLPTGGVHDFDFFVGSWRGANRRLRQRWTGSTEWDEFPGTLRCESRMQSVVNIDEVDFPTRGFSGMTVRVFNRGERRWYLYWINNRTGALFPPVIGGFTGNRGEFYGDDTDDGRPVKVQYLWTIVDPDTAHWQQAFSLDGTRWEVNWTVIHTRMTG